MPQTSTTILTTEPRLGAGAPDAPVVRRPASTLTVAQVRIMFPQTPAAPIERNLPAILAALHNAGLDDARMLLTALSTIRAEVECFEPIEEAMSGWNTSPGGHPFDLYDHRPGLGNCGAPDGATFRGRGFVQLTGRRNYIIFGAASGTPGLASDPARACDPDVAARLLAAFLKARRPAITAALLADDLPRARRLVNGGENGLLRFTDAYRRGERLLGLVR